MSVNFDNFWSFKNYRAWNKTWKKCSYNSKNQSPININRDKVEPCSSLCRLRLNYQPSKCNVVTHNEVITIRYDAGSYAYYNNDAYELMEAKIHIPSMHLVDGQHFDMEVDLYHCRTTDRSASKKPGGSTTICPDGGLIIGIFCQSGLEHGKSVDFFNQFINKVPIPETLVNEPVERSIPVSTDWSIGNIIPKNKSFYTYKGSRPYPPCDEDWTWVVFQDYVTIGSSLYEKLKYNLSDNYRPHLPIFNRVVYHYNEPKLQDPLESEEPENKEGVLSMLESRKRNAWFERNREFIKHLLFTVIVIALILLALRLVVVVLRTGMFQNWTQKQLLKKQANDMGIPMNQMGGQTNNMINGMASNGMASNGMASNGMASNGMGSNMTMANQMNTMPSTNGMGNQMNTMPSTNGMGANNMTHVNTMPTNVIPQ